VATIAPSTRLANGTYLSQDKSPSGTTEFISVSGSIVTSTSGTGNDAPAFLVTTPNYNLVDNEGITDDNLSSDYSFMDSYSYTQKGSSSRDCNWWTLCIDSTVTTTYELIQKYTTITTQSLKADYPIAINFIGQNSASVEVTSATDVTLNGQVSARNGDVEIAANGAGHSIIAGNPGALITGRRIALTAGGSVGTGAAAVQLRMDGAAAGNGALVATAAAGNVNLNADNGIVVQRVTAAGDPTTDKGNVIITSGTDIIAGKVAQFFTTPTDTKALIQAPRVILTAGNGDVGSIANPLTVNTGYSLASRSFGDSVDPDPYYGLSVLAAGDIGIASTSWGDNTQTWTGNADGTMLVDQVVSLGGDVFLESTGQILDNNPTQTVDTRTYNELLGYWNTLGLVRGSTENAAKVQLAIDAFANGRTADYRAYWQIRMTQPDGGADFDPSYEFTLATDSLQYEALVDQGVDIAALAKRLGRTTIGAEDIEGGTQAAPAGDTGYWDVDHAQYGPVTEEPLSRFAQVAARNLAAAQSLIPAVTHHDRADISALERLRRAWKSEAQARGVKLTALAFHVVALARALRAFPRFNASLSADAQTLILKDYVHIGIAVDTPHGLMVPVIRDADRKGLWQIAEDIAELAARAQARKIGPDEMGGASMTITNLGGIGGTGFSPIVNPPEVAILGITRTQTVTVWEGDTPRPVPMVPLDLSYDHRVINGADAARFMAQYCAMIADPRQMLI